MLQSRSQAKTGKTACHLRRLVDFAEPRPDDVRLDVFTIERPVEPWLTEARDPGRIRRELTDELDGGPPPGARPRLVGGELWFTQSWAFFAVEPADRPRRAAAPRPR